MSHPAPADDAPPTPVGWLASRGVGVGEIVIAVGDLEAGIAFYTEVCGMGYVRTDEVAGGRLAVLDAGGHRVSLVEGDAPGLVLALTTRDADGERRRLERRDVVAGQVVQAPGGRWVSFTDPWGNRLGFWESR